jgi:hypothetical protein
MPTKRRAKKTWVSFLGKDERDALTFLLGLAGVIHELVTHQAGERPYLLTVLGGLLGLPLVLRKNDQLKEGEEEEGET